MYRLRYTPPEAEIQAYVSYDMLAYSYNSDNNSEYIAAALALVGCSGLEVEVSEPIQPFILTIENQETKAILDSDANG